MADHHNAGQEVASNHVLMRRVLAVLFANDPGNLEELRTVSTTVESEILSLLRRLHDIEFVSIVSPSTTPMLQFGQFLSRGVPMIESNLRMLATYATGLRSLDFTKALAYPAAQYHPLAEISGLTKLAFAPWERGVIDPTNPNHATFVKLYLNSMTTLKELVNPMYTFMTALVPPGGRLDLNVLEADLRAFNPGTVVDDDGSTYVHEALRILLEIATNKLKVKKLVLIGQNRTRFNHYYTPFIQFAMVEELTLKSSPDVDFSDDLQFIARWFSDNTKFPKVQRLNLCFSAPILDEAVYQQFLKQVSAVFPNLHYFELSYFPISRAIVPEFEIFYRRYWRLKINDYTFEHLISATFPKPENDRDPNIDGRKGTQILQKKVEFYVHNTRFPVTLTLNYV